MANTLDRVNVTFPILKYDTTDDGDLLVYGKATDATIDSDDQIVDADWSAKALEEWLKTGGNIRVQHSPYLYPAGKGVEVEATPEGHYVKALVVEENAKNLVRKGVLTAYSVGIGRPQIVRDTAAKGGRIVGGKLIEISLVDRPANANCGFTMCKSADGAVVDTDEVWGDLQAALQRAEEKVDTALDFESLLAEGKPVERKATKAASLSEADLVKEWSEDRERFIASMPELEGDGTVTAEWQLWKAEKDAFFDMSDESRSLWAAKRDFDANVGGGTDRDKIPAEDFAGPGRSFPIVTPGDVSDAASSLGRAKGDQSAIKRNIIRIAHRKGKDFVAELPDAWKDDGDKAVETTELEKAGNSTGADADGYQPKPYNHDGNETVKCPKCGKGNEDDAKYCDQCGSKLVGSTDVGKSEDEPVVEKGSKDCPKCGKNYDADSKQRNCEKCGADLPNANKSEDEPELPALPYTLKRLHDVFCGVYSDATLQAEYASLKSWADAVNVDAVRAEFGDELAEVAIELKAADADMVADARASLHKSFADMYPNTSATPGSIEPGRFRRGYVSAGHQRQNASGSDSGARIPDSNRVIEPGQFDRGALTAGHERPSPAAGGDNATKGVNGSVSPPSNFASASAAYTRNQMRSIHDHISERRPDVCGFSQKQTDMPADMNAGAVLKPVTGHAPDGPGKSVDPDYIKALVDAAVAEKTAYHEDVIAKLRKEVDDLGAQPDPAQAPVRVTAKSAVADSAKAVEAAAEDEERESEVAKLTAYAAKFQFDGNPAMRKLADETLTKLQSRD